MCHIAVARNVVVPPSGDHHRNMVVPQYVKTTKGGHQAQKLGPCVGLPYPGSHVAPLLPMQCPANALPMRQPLWPGDLALCCPLGGLRGVLT